MRPRGIHGLPLDEQVAQPTLSDIYTGQLRMIGRAGSAILLAAGLTFVPSQIIHFGNQILEEQCSYNITAHPDCGAEQQDLLVRVSEEPADQLQEDIASSKRWRDLSLAGMALGGAIKIVSAGEARLLRRMERKNKAKRNRPAAPLSNSVAIERIERDTTPKSKRLFGRRKQ